MDTLGQLDIDDLLDLLIETADELRQAELKMPAFVGRDTLWNRYDKIRETESRRLTELRAEIKRRADVRQQYNV